MRTVYLNGQFVPESEAKVSIYDLSVMQSAAAFEMTRSFGGVHFKLREHLTRLVESCKLLAIALPKEIGLTDTLATYDDIKKIIDEVTRRNDHGPGEEHRLLIVVSPGCAEIYRDLEGTIAHPFIYIADFPLRFTVAGFSKYFLEGVHAVTSTIQQVPDASVPSQAKHRSRLHFHLAQSQAPPGTWPLLLDRDGYLCEAPGANLVVVQDEGVWALTRQCLPGISQRTVIDLTDADTMDDFAIEDLRDIDELFLTGTPFAMIPVVSLDGKPIGDGQIGPVYQETLAKWNALVGLDIAQQMIAWDQHKVWTPDAQRLSATQY